MAPLILAIDDDRAILELYGYLLTDEGYDVHLCQEGAQGAEMVRRVNPAVVLLDGLMRVSPRGDYLWQVLAQEAHLGAARLLLCSADPRLVKEQEEFFASIGGAVICKPFDIDDLLLLVTQLSVPLERAASPV